MRITHTQALHNFSPDSQNFHSGNISRNRQAEILFAQDEKYTKFGYKCFSPHQILAEIIHLIDSEGIQNKEQNFNCTKWQKFVHYKDILD